MVFASTEEIDQILAQIDLRDPMGVRDWCMLTLVRHTGLRVAELAGLDVHDVLGAGEIRSTLHVRAEIAKGLRPRIVPLNAAARQAIARQVDFLRRRGFSTRPEAPLFVTKSHRRITTRAIQYVVAELRAKADLAAPISPHSFRHNFASRVAETTGNIRVVQKLLGHKRLKTSQVYTHPSRAELERAVDRLV
jgi:integrase/recombinase XerC